MQIKASTPEQMRDAIVRLIDGWASNARIKASNAKLIGYMKEENLKAQTYEGAARLIEKLEIVPSNEQQAYNNYVKACHSKIGEFVSEFNFEEWIKAGKPIGPN